MLWKFFQFIKFAWHHICARGSLTSNEISVRWIITISIWPSIFLHQISQAGTSWGESSKPDLFLNFILKVRMLRFSRHSRLKCRKSSFWEQKHCFWAFRRTEDWGLKIEDWGQPFHLLWLASFSPFETTKILKNPHKLEKSSKPGLKAWTTCATLSTGITTPLMMMISDIRLATF